MHRNQQMYDDDVSEFTDLKLADLPILPDEIARLLLHNITRKNTVKTRILLKLCEKYLVSPSVAKQMITLACSSDTNHIQKTIVPFLKDRSLIEGDSILKLLSRGFEANDILEMNDDGKQCLVCDFISLFMRDTEESWNDLREFYESTECKYSCTCGDHLSDSVIHRLFFIRDRQVIKSVIEANGLSKLEKYVRTTKHIPLAYVNVIREMVDVFKVEFSDVLKLVRSNENEEEEESIGSVVHLISCGTMKFDLTYLDIDTRLRIETELSTLVTLKMTCYNYFETMNNIPLELCSLLSDYIIVTQHSVKRSREFDLSDDRSIKRARFV